jgi:hypothetical protein
MIANIFLPSPTSAMADRSDRRVSRQRTTARLALLLNLCIPLRWNNRLDSLLVQRFIDFPFVVIAVAVKPIDLACHLIQKGIHLAAVVATVVRQCIRFDLVRIRVDRQMESRNRDAATQLVLASWSALR